MKKVFSIFFMLSVASICYSQNNVSLTTTASTLRVNAVNPGVEFEAKITRKSTLALNLGFGYGGSYKNLSSDASGWLYMYSPFMDVHYKLFHNLDKRAKAGKNIEYNSGNFFGFRFLTRGKEFDSNFKRTSDYDFSFGPTYGWQRSYNRFHFLFNLGLNYYFDGKGNNGIIPMLELNVGYNLFSR